MKLNYRRTFLVGLGFFSICAFWQLYDHVVPLILKYNFGIDETRTGVVMAMDNVLALFMLPLFGSFSDRTKTRWGRRMPYIVLGGFASAIVMMLIPISARLFSLPLFITGLALTLLFMSTYRSPAVALMPDVTIKPLRSKANAVINLMGAAGGIIILGLINLLLPKIDTATTAAYTPDYVPVYLACMAVMVISTVALMLFINEPKLAQKMQDETKALGIEDGPTDDQKGKTHIPLPRKKRPSMIFLLASIALWFMGYNAVTTAFSRYTFERFNMQAGASALVLIVAQVAAIASYLPVGIIATKLGRKKCIMGGVVLLAASFGTATLFDTFTPLIYVLFVLAGIAWAAINVNSYPMVVEMSSGTDIGRYTGYYYFASMAAQVVTPILSGYIMQHVSYSALFPYAATFVALSFVTMIFVRFGDAKPLPPKNKLEAFEAMDD